VACSELQRAHVMVANETAMRLLQATREQLHSKPIRQVIPFEDSGGASFPGVTRPGYRLATT
jgi:hypothetical protein